MAITIEKTIDLTDYERNPAPSIVKQLSIVHEAKDGELVQYYIDPQGMVQEDKNTYAVGIYDEDTDTWSFVEYDEVYWGDAKQRICGNRLERLGVKAFPNIGSIAFYKLAYRDISRIVAPVNPEYNRPAAPSIEGMENTDGTITITITPPEKEEYVCYRIIMKSGDFSEDHITYDLTTTFGVPSVSGRYECFAIGYQEEGQICSKDSNVLKFLITGSHDSYESPFYSTAYIESLEKRIKALEESG